MVSEKWVQVGGPAVAVIAGPAGTFATTPVSGDIFKLSGSVWSRIGGPGSMFACGTYLYGLTPDKQEIWEYSEGVALPGAWTLVGGPADAILSSLALYRIHPTTGNIEQYDRNAKTWTVIGTPGAMFVATSDGNLYGLAPNRDAVYRYSGTPFSWEPIRGPADAIIGSSCGNRLCALQPRTGNLDLFNATDRSWKQIGGPGAEFAVPNRGLFGLSPTRKAVYRYVGPDQEWQKIGGPADAIYPAYNDALVYALSPDSHDVWALVGPIIM